MANPNRMPNPPMITSQPQQMHHPQFSQGQATQMMQNHPQQQVNTATVSMPQAAGQTGLTPLQIPTHTSPTKEPQVGPAMNAASLCRMGQEMVQEIVQRLSEVFQTQKQLSLLPNGVQQNLLLYQERNKLKLEECLNQTTNQMRNLKMIYMKVSQICGGPNEGSEINLIPYEEGPQVKPNHSREYQYANDELREVSEQIRIKNRQLKEIIDKLRTIVWEIYSTSPSVHSDELQSHLAVTTF